MKNVQSEISLTKTSSQAYTTRNKLIMARQTYTRGCVNSSKATLLIERHTCIHLHCTIRRQSWRSDKSFTSKLFFSSSVERNKKEHHCTTKLFSRKTQNKKNTQARTGSALSSVSDNQPEIHTFTNCDNEWGSVCVGWCILANECTHQIFQETKVGTM